MGEKETTTAADTAARSRPLDVSATPGGSLKADPADAGNAGDRGIGSPMGGSKDRGIGSPMGGSKDRGIGSPTGSSADGIVEYQDGDDMTHR